MCTKQAPWQISETLSYGFAAAKLAGGSESSWCCACYKLTFTSGPSTGKEHIVQVINTGKDLGEDHFDIAIPGGGFGLFDGCTQQWEESYKPGKQYGGIHERTDCDSYPDSLRPGCYWRFDFLSNADNPEVTFDGRYQWPQP